jgi:hypothetical protein
VRQYLGLVEETEVFGDLFHELASAWG